MAEKLIPGITHPTRISILQQIDGEYTAGGTDGLSLEKGVLESVLSSDEARNQASRTADCKCLPASPATEVPLDAKLTLSSAVQEFRNRGSDTPSSSHSRNSARTSDEEVIPCPKDGKPEERYPGSAGKEGSQSSRVKFGDFSGNVSLIGKIPRNIVISNFNRLNQDSESIDADALQADTQAAIEMLETVQSRLEAVSSHLTFSFHHLT